MTLKSCASICGSVKDAAKRTLINTLNETPSAFSWRVVGLGLLMAWFYCAYYSCVLVQNPYTIRASEQYWGLSLIVAVCVSIALFALMRKGVQLGDIRHWGFAASACAASATVFIYAAYILDPINERLTIVGAVIAGAALPILLLTWLQELRQCNASALEASVPAAFLCSLALYLPVVAIKNVVSVAIVASFPLLSLAIFSKLLGMRLAQGKSDDEKDAAGAAHHADAAKLTTEANLQLLGASTPAAQDPLSQAHGVGASFYRNAKGLWKNALLFSLLWFNFAFFRGFVSPTYFTDRFDHYLLPFVCAGLLAALILTISFRHARTVSLFTTYRWVLPFACAGYALVFIGEAPWVHFAYTASFIGLVGMQLCALAIIAKNVQRAQIPTGYVLFPLLVAVGVGASTGVTCGIATMQTQGASASSFFPLAMVVLVASVMAWGCDTESLVKAPERSLVPVTQLENNRDAATEPAHMYMMKVPRAELIDRVADLQANALAKQFGLSPREKEILGYLLAGRSRSFVRDELVLSLNTVNTHVRKIYAKTGVHSQQELISLARKDEGGDKHLEASESFLPCMQKSG
ncbi:hypothetical protein DMP06_00570 [Slackia equolifaciens]|uniref:HTH luxR-type domain-containing protein n=1 Tax=Slackia equolifaciens TaxID=498718 RepID=A0A3N0B497_9ACTN|nr:helix-turn-helix transcriptional regulator [Slackia equolifaciens]RNL41941.1 hypothetical protein DMP06_00570 [Slackia equolifaciens]